MLTAYGTTMMTMLMTNELVTYGQCYTAITISVITLNHQLTNNHRLTMNLPSNNTYLSTN